MRPALFTLVMLVAAVAPARADDGAPLDEAALEAQEREFQRAVATAIARPILGHRAAPLTWNLGVEARAVGQRVDSGAGGGATIAAHGDVTATYEYGVWSSYVATGGGVRAQTEPGLAPLGFDHWAAVRPWQLGVFTFEVDHQLTVEGRPALSRRPDVWQRSFTSEHVGVEMTGLHWRGHRWGVHLMRIEEGFDFTWQRDEDRRFGTTSDWSVFGVIRDPGDGSDLAVLELLSLEAEAIDDERDAAVMNTLLVRFTGVPLGPLPVRVDGAIGAGATGYTTLSSGDNSITITTEDLPLVSGVPVWRARIHGGGERVTASAGASRSLFLTYDVNLALEERATAAVAVDLDDDGRVELEGFAARTQLWTDETTSYVEHTGGGSVRYERPVRDGWTVDVSGQAARSFYADLAGDHTPHAAVATRFEIGLRKQLGGSRDLRQAR